MPDVRTVQLHGVTGIPVVVTATVVDGPPRITLPGVADPVAREVLDRLHTALATAGQSPRPRAIELTLDPPTGRLTETTICALATAVIAASVPVRPDRLASVAVIGDLYLDGTIRPVLGVLPAVQAARDHGILRVIVPSEALDEADLVDDVDVLGADTLTEVVGWLRGEDTLGRPDASEPGTDLDAPGRVEDTAFPLTRMLPAPVLRAVEIAAAGGHNILLNTNAHNGIGLVAHWLHRLLPELTLDQQIEVATVQSLVGPREDGETLNTTPPLLATQPGTLLANLVGGGLSGRPGVVARAHHGVLLTPDLAEFDVERLEFLRAALSEQQVRIIRGSELQVFPARVQLCATVRGCVCGVAAGEQCLSTREQRRGYRARIPAGLLDLIDLRIPLCGGKFDQSDDPELVRHAHAQARERVEAARDRAAARWGRLRMTGPDATNAAVPARALPAYRLPGEVTDPIARALAAGALSRSGAGSVLRIAYTAADLDGASLPGPEHVAEALRLRQTPWTDDATGPQVS